VFKKYTGSSTEDAKAPAPKPAASTSSAPTPAATPPSQSATQTTSAPTQSAPAQQSSGSSAAGKRNVLSNDVEIKGNVKFDNDLLVDGKIDGEINSGGSLTIGENARIKAEIKTKSVVIYGKVHGNITVTDRVELKANAEMVGDIKAAVLSVEAGATFVGKSTVGAPSSLPAAASNNNKGNNKASVSASPQKAAAK